MDSLGLHSNDDTEDVSLNFGEEDKAVRTIRHPLAVVFHMLFRIGAILSYLLCGLFSSSFIANFVVVVVFLSMDFWTVKNITGRLLVGLRWWNHVDEDGKSHWVYETKKGTAKSLITNTEARVFWLSLVVCQLVWMVFFFGTLFTLNFKWFMVVCVGVCMNGANLYGYIRCKVGAKKEMSSVATNFLGRHLFKSMTSQQSTTTSQQ